MYISLLSWTDADTKFRPHPLLNEQVNVLSVEIVREKHHFVYVLNQVNSSLKPGS